MGTSFPCCGLTFPDGSAYGHMCAQAEHVVPVLAAELPLLAARTDSLWPCSLQCWHLSLSQSCDPAQPVLLG